MTIDIPWVLTGLEVSIMYHWKYILIPFSFLLFTWSIQEKVWSIQIWTITRRVEILYIFNHNYSKDGRSSLNYSNWRAIQKNKMFWISSICKQIIYLCVKSKLKELQGHKVISAMLHKFQLLLLSGLHWLSYHISTVWMLETEFRRKGESKIKRYKEGESKSLERI